VVLTLAASDDQQARTLHVRVTSLVWLYRFLFAFGSVGAGLVAALFARELRARYDERGQEAERVVALIRTEQGGFEEEKPAAEPAAPV
jgi:hypothetical protein